MDSDKDSCTAAPQTGATVRDPVEQGAGEASMTGGGGRPPPSNPSSENLEGLTEKVGTLGIRATSKNCCGAAKKRANRPRLVEAPPGDSGGGQPRSTPGGRPQSSPKPGTSGVQPGTSTESGGLPPSRSKRQRSTGGTPEGGGQAKRPKQVGKLSYGRVAREGLQVAVVCENYQESQICKENFLDIQQAISRLVDDLPEE